MLSWRGQEGSFEIICNLINLHGRHIFNCYNYIKFYTRLSHLFIVLSNNMCRLVSFGFLVDDMIDYTVILAYSASVKVCKVLTPVSSSSPFLLLGERHIF